MDRAKGSSGESFLRRSGDALVVDCDHLDIYVPKEYFEDEIAEIVGEAIKTIGILFMRVRNGESQGVFHKMVVPNVVTFNYSGESESTESFFGEPESYMVYTLERDEVFMVSEMFITSAKNVEKYANCLHAGRIPAGKYADNFTQYLDIQRSNGMSMGVPSSTLEVIISELARWSGDITVPYRLALAKGAGPSDFKMSRIKQLPYLNGTYSAVAFEDIGLALINGVVRSARGTEEPSTPMEDVVKY
jgi:hypothetical protein